MQGENRVSRQVEESAIFSGWALCVCVCGRGNMWQTNWWADVGFNPPHLPSFSLEPHWVPCLWDNGCGGSQHQIKPSLFLSGVRGQVVHCLPGLKTLKNVHVPLEKGGNQEGRVEGMCVMPSEGLTVTPQTTRWDIKKNGVSLRQLLWNSQRRTKDWNVPSL